MVCLLHFLQEQNKKAKYDHHGYINPYNYSLSSKK